MNLTIDRGWSRYRAKNLRGTIDCSLADFREWLIAEGKCAPNMMSVGLHCRLVGRPGRAAALIRFLDHVMKHERVWVATRLDIARHWRSEHANLTLAAPPADLSPKAAESKKI